MADPAPSAPLLVSGVLLAGGQSSRMGRNKALITVEGVVLWRIQLGLLATSGGGDMLVSVRSGTDWLPADVPKVEDDGRAGPLGGISAAMAKCRGTHLMVLAVDLPEITSAWWTELRAACEPGVGAVGREPTGYFEPLAAIYPVELLGAMREAIAKGNFSLQHFVVAAIARGAMKELPITAAQTKWFKNLNFPSDMEGLKA